jgi:hypothetical protein
VSTYTFETDMDGDVSNVAFTDPVPTVDTGSQYHCRVCGKELEYGGRGRKPTLCDEHKKGAAKSKTPAPRASSKNASLAADAASALCNMHSMVAIGAGFVGFSETAGTIVAANDPFYEAARSALSTDPELCRRILSSGAGTGSIALVVAYGMFLSAVVPAAVNERRVKVEERRLASSDEENVG